jgi:hypothetical protein
VFCRLVSLYSSFNSRTCGNHCFNNFQVWPFRSQPQFDEFQRSRADHAQAESGWATNLNLTAHGITVGREVQNQTLARGDIHMATANGLEHGVTR